MILAPDVRMPMTADVQSRAVAASERLRAQGEHLKQRWLDAPMWDRLYSQFNLRKPPSYLPCSPKYMRRYLSKAEVAVSQCLEFTGFRTLKAYGETNPNVPLWAFLGTILEAKASGVFTSNPAP
ncbi:hypothetical protein [Caballeronia sp. ATUFL_M1_KS5A]|uniref:hypothetical protein n=1 Tax=Caballeronia sp. ATUFL_M1_KS5A TaxID=2921778 RepID=UPI0020294B92|nr:hypothetical protein [Caballeronia sp. ATUFL_M1_KS5A]